MYTKFIGVNPWGENNCLLTESGVFMGKSQTETLPFRPSDGEVNTARLRFKIFPARQFMVT